MLLLFMCISCFQKEVLNPNTYEVCINREIEGALVDFYGKSNKEVNFFKTMNHFEESLIKMELISKERKVSDYWNLIIQDARNEDLKREILNDTVLRQQIKELEAIPMFSLIIFNQCVECNGVDFKTSYKNLLFTNSLVFEGVQRSGHDQAKLLLLLNNYNNSIFDEADKRAPFLYSLYCYWRFTYIQDKTSKLLNPFQKVQIKKSDYRNE